MRFLLFLSFIFLLGSSSCNKKEACQDTVTYSYLAYCLAPYLFNDNSQWIYQNTSSLAYDTTRVIDWVHEYKSFANPVLDCYDYYEVEVITINYQSTLRDDFKEELYGNIISPTPSFTDATYECSEITIIDSVFVDSTMYYDVAVYTNNSDEVISYYRKDGIGIIRWIEYSASDSTVYDLIDHNVSLFEKPL